MLDERGVGKDGCEWECNIVQRQESRKKVDEKRE